MSATQPRAATATGVGTPTETVPRNTIQGMGRAGTQTNPHGDLGHSDEPQIPPDDDDKPRGFWGSLFKKRK
jgi:hypothetical protein